MGIGALVAGSIGSSLIGAVSAGKAAKAQSQAAEQANETQRYIFDKNVELTEPWRAAGENALAALAFESGIGPRPTFGGTSSGLTIEEVQGGGGLGGVGGLFSFDGGNRDGIGASQPHPAFSGADLEARRADWRTALGGAGGGGGTTFRVGDRVFSSRDAAQEYLDSLSTGGTEYQGFKATPGYQFRREEGEQGLERYAAARGMRLSGASLKSAARFNDGIAAQEYGNHYNRLAALSGTGQTAAGQQQAAGTNYANAFGQNALAGGAAQAAGIAGVNNAIQGGFTNMFDIFGMKKMGYFD